MLDHKKILFLLPKRTMNEATIYYVDIIKTSFQNSGFDVLESEELKDVKKYKNIFVMSAKWCFLVKLFNFNARVVTWFQGLGGEEALMRRNSKRDKFLWSCVEGFSIKFSYLNIYVSECMRQYYSDRYKGKGVNENYFIMPCFNKDLNVNAFDLPDKYHNLSFVYAGGLDKWQCIETTLEIYKKIEDKYPKASITLLTKQSEEASKLLEKFSIKNGAIKFVSLDSLDNELSQYKYGFLIRENHIVNNVSTPTKMNSYLANGIIPIYTDVIADFKSNLKSNLFLRLKHQEQVDDWVKHFFQFNDFIDHNIDLIKSDVLDIFSHYYSREYYVNSLSEKIDSLDFRIV